MKKLIISLLASLALLFGLAGCSGDLHDAPAFNLDAAGGVGTLLGWDGTAFTKVDSSTYTVDFTASATEGTFTIQEKLGSWASRWCGDGVSDPYIVGTEKVKMVYVVGGDPAHYPISGLTINSEYTIKVTINPDDPSDTSVWFEINPKN